MFQFQFTTRCVGHTHTELDLLDTSDSCPRNFTTDSSKICQPHWSTDRTGEERSPAFLKRTPAKAQPFSLPSLGETRIFMEGRDFEKLAKESEETNVSELPRPASPRCNSRRHGILQKAATDPNARPSLDSNSVDIAKGGSKRSDRMRKLDLDVKVEVLSCSVCDYSCTRKRTLNGHMKKHDSSKQFTCSECTYTTPRSTDLKKHVRIHTGEKPFRCEQCDYKSTEQGSLRKHMLTHNCEVAHRCAICDYVSPRIGDLKRHMHVHDDKNHMPVNKPHACQHCDYKTAELRRLRNHMLIHTGQKPYQCTYCDYRCRELTNLKTHEQTHTGEKPYSCPHCQYKAGRLGRLKQHLSRIHPPDDPPATAALPRHFLDSISDDQEDPTALDIQ